MASVLIPLYLVAGVFAAWWSFHNGNHREEASTTAKIIGSIIAGLVWPAIIIDLWLLDPDDTRRNRRSK